MAARRVHRNFVGCYVYVLTVDGVHRYVGKGKRYRVVDHMARIRAYASGRPMYEPRHLPAYLLLGAAYATGAVIDYQIVLNNLTDDEAWAAERIQIASYPEGQLWNVQAGGRGDTGGRRLRAIWKDPVRRAELAARIRAGHLEDKYRDRVRLKTQEQWADPGFRERWLRQHKEAWADPDTAARRKAKLRAVWADRAESREKVRQAVKLSWTPERRAAMADNRRKAWADPEFAARVRAKIAASKSLPGHKAKASASLAKAWKTRKAKLANPAQFNLPLGTS